MGLDKIKMPTSARKIPSSSPQPAEEYVEMSNIKSVIRTVYLA